MTYHLLRQRILRELRAILDPIEAQQEARRWFQDGLGIDAAWLGQRGTDPVPEGTERRVEAWLKRRRQGEPWALILGWTTFCGRPFRVAKGALIPHLESETTVRVALETGHALRVRRCVEVGAGVGSIGLTLALETSWELLLTEVDPAVLKLAKANARALGAKVRQMAGELLQRVPDPLELVVANLPCVDESQAVSLEADFNFEPAMALLAPRWRHQPDCHAPGPGQATRCSGLRGGDRDRAGTGTARTDPGAGLGQCLGDPGCPRPGPGACGTIPVSWKDAPVL